MTNTSGNRYWIVFALLLLSLPAAAQETKPDIARVERAIVSATNEFRRTQKQSKLNPNPVLSQTALEFARFMARSGKYGHNADGRTPEQRARERGYDYCAVAENIAYIFSSKPLGADQLARQFVRGWENSPGHRRNMLNPDVTQIGVAVARSDKTKYYYAVQLFGRPKSETISFQIENRTGDTVSYNLNDRSLTLAPGVIRTHQQCGTTELKLGAVTAGPKNGERYIVTKENAGSYRLNKQ